MNNVITFDQIKWNTMKMLKEGIAFYRTHNSDGNFNTVIEMETKLLKDYMKGIN